jgi:hypothetical protein
LPLSYLRDIFGSHFITGDGSNYATTPTVPDARAAATAADPLPDERCRRVLLDSAVRAAL